MESRRHAHRDRCFPPSRHLECLRALRRAGDSRWLTDRITAVRFTPDNQRLLIADGRIAEEGTVRIADPNTGALQVSWPAHSDTIFDLAISPDGTLAATAGGDKLVKIWDISTQKEPPASRPTLRRSSLCLQT
jgi:WD40 repeat protein